MNNLRESLRHMAPERYHYTLENLAQHLSKAGSYKRLAMLFDNDAWMHSRVEDSNYTYDGYLDDLILAWSDAEEEARSCAEQESLAFARCIRYLLIWSSVNSLVGRYVPAIVGQAVREGVWTPQRGMSLLTRVPDNQRKVELCLTLLQTEKLTNEQRRIAQSQGVTAVLALRFLRMKWLTALAPWLTDQAFEQALNAVVRMRQSGERVQALVALSPHLPKERWEIIVNQAIDSTLATKWAFLRENEDTSGDWADEESFSKATIALVPWLTGQKLEQVLSIVRTLELVGPRIEALAALSPLMSKSQRRAILEEALSEALTFTKERVDIYGGRYVSDRARALVALLPVLTDDSLEQASRAAMTINYTYPGYAAVLRDLTRCLPKELLSEALQSFLSLKDERAKAAALGALAPRLTQVELKQVLSIAQAFRDKRAQAEILALLAPQLSKEQGKSVLEQTLRYALSVPLGGRGVGTMAIKLERVQEEILTTLAPQLTGDLLAQALQGMLTLRDEEELAITLATLAPRLPERLRRIVLDQALGYALDIKYELGLWGALRPLALQLPVDALQRLLQIQTARGDTGLHSEAVISTNSSALPRRMRERLVHDFESGWEEKVVSLNAHWYAVRRIVLEVLASQASDDVLEQVLQHELKSDNEWHRANALRSLAPRLKSPSLELALSVALSLRNPWARAEALTALLPLLPKEQQEKIVEEVFDTVWALEFKSIDQKSDPLERLLPFVTDVLQERILDSIFALKDESDQVSLLVYLAPSLKRTMPEKFFQRILILMRKHEPRSSELVMLLALASPKRRNSVLESALHTALSLTFAGYRAATLKTLALYLPDNLVQQALQGALALPDQWAQATALKGLIPRLTGDLLEQAYHSLWRMKPSGYQVDALVTLALQFPVKQRRKLLEKALDVTLALKDTNNQRWAFEVVIPQLPDDLLRRLLEQSFSTILARAYREESLKLLLETLAPHISVSMIGQEMRAMREIAPKLTEIDDEIRINNAVELLVLLKAFLSLKDIQSLLLDILQIIKFWSRGRALNLLVREHLLVSPVISHGILEAIVSSLIEIVDEWQWL